MKKGILAIDNPLNGYVDGHCDSEDLGIFILSPGALHTYNNPPILDHVWLWSEVDNSFDNFTDDFGNE